jgi:hypothetical protein
VSEPASEPSEPAQSNEPTPVAPLAHVTATRTQPQSILPAVLLRRRSDELLLAYAGEPTSAPARELHAASFVWGLAQPLLGLRMLWRHTDLLARAVLPVLGFVAVCLVIADRGDGTLSWIAAYYLTLIAAAPLSPVLFCRNYARLAALARPHLGLEPREPYLRSPRQIVIEAVVQLIILAIGIAPLVGLIAVIPLLGPIWAAVLGYLWALHWIVVEALDSARTLAPGEAEPTPIEGLDPAWYAAPARWHVRGWAGIVLAPVRLWSRLLGRLGAHWRGEVAIIERRPWIAGGFALGSALLLALPILNLLFRPAVVIAATHVLGRLEGES